MHRKNTHFLRAEGRVADDSQTVELTIPSGT